MSEATLIGKFIVWLLQIALILGGIGLLGKATYKMGVITLEAKQSSISYGSFSRSLWSQPQKKKAPNKATR